LTNASVGAKSVESTNNHQTNYLLDQLIRWLEQDFIKQGGIRERMTRARLQYRNKKEPGD
jgi:four helix bundle suffix protein